MRARWMAAPVLAALMVAGRGRMGGRPGWRRWRRRRWRLQRRECRGRWRNGGRGGRRRGNRRRRGARKFAFHRCGEQRRHAVSARVGTPGRRPQQPPHQSTEHKRVERKRQSVDDGFRHTQYKQHAVDQQHGDTRHHDSRARRQPQLDDRHV